MNACRVQTGNMNARSRSKWKHRYRFSVSGRDCDSWRVCDLSTGARIDHSLLARWFASPSAAHLAAHGVKRLVLMQSLSILWAPPGFRSVE